jgi:superfamily II DNA or RNA helicase
MKYSLYPHQEIVVGKIRQSAKEGKKKILVFAATGFGKTIISYDIIKNAISRGNSVLFTSHRITLAEQSAEKFSDLNPEYLQGDQKEVSSDYKILVATLQTLMNTEITAPKIVVIDEVHYAYESNYIQSLFSRFPDAIFIGLSATPVDERGFLLDGFDVIIDDYQTSDLIDMGFLTPFKIFAPMSIDTSSVRMKGDDYDEKELEKVINKSDINDSIVSNYIKFGEQRKFICFCVNEKHCNDLKNAFYRLGILTEVISAKTSKKKRDEILDKYSRNEIHGLLSIEILTAGFDDQTVRCVILATVSKSWRKYIQMCGRGIRLWGKSIQESIQNGKPDCVLLDCAGNIEEHGLPTDRKILTFKKKISKVIDRELGLDTDNEKRQSVVMTEEKQVYLKKIGSLLDIYEGKVYNSEAKLQEDANKYLDKTGWFYWRQNSGSAFMDGRWVSFTSKPGLPDNALFLGGTSLYIGIELKLPKGYLTPNQKITLPQMISNGILVFICESIYDIYKAIEHVESNVIQTEEYTMIMNTIYELPERQLELRRKLKLI